METVLLTIPLKPFAIIPKIVLQQRNSASRHKKLEPLVKWASEVFYPLFLFYNPIFDSWKTKKRLQTQ